MRLPAGTIELSSELVIPQSARDMQVAGAPNGTLLRASAGFRGRALIRVEPGARIQLKGFTLDGNRAALGKPRRPAALGRAVLALLCQ